MEIGEQHVLWSNWKPRQHADDVLPLQKDKTGRVDQLWSVIIHSKTLDHCALVTLHVGLYSSDPE